MKVLDDQLQRSVCRTLQTEQLHEMHHRRLYVLNNGPLVRWQQCCPVLLPLPGSIRSLSPRQIHTYTPRVALNAETAARAKQGERRTPATLATGLILELDLETVPERSPTTSSRAGMGAGAVGTSGARPHCRCVFSCT